MAAPQERRWLQPAEQQAATDAEQLITFADGFEIAFPDIGGRCRSVARELLWALQQLEAERSARRSMQEQRDQARQVIHDQGVRLLQSKGAA